MWRKKSELIKHLRKAKAMAFCVQFNPKVARLDIRLVSSSVKSLPQHLPNYPKATEYFSVSNQIGKILLDLW